MVWFRRDLRVHDHPALSDAVARGVPVVPLFVLDDRLLEGRWPSPNRRWSLLGALHALDAQLRARGARLVIRHGPPEQVVPAVAREVGATDVLVSRDVGPWARARDHRVATALADEGRVLRARAGLLLAEPESIATADGRPFTVFSPFWRALSRADRRAPLVAPTVIPFADIAPGTIPAAGPPPADLPRPGEGAARDRLAAWMADGLSAYHDRRDLLDGSGTSRLGADLHLGTLSVIELDALAAAHGGPGADAWRRQLGWRDFAHHLLWHRPELAKEPFRPALARALRPATEDPDAVAAWREGRTGIPVVDAAMRQLLATGWMSNRARLVVASFLTRHLLVDHRVGEDHFMRHLVDGDLANDGLGWQWTAGVGTDAQPWFRIFDPVRQGTRFDPDGGFVRRWVPEVAALPDDLVHTPWLAADGPPDGYPAPVVDLREGRDRALAAFRAAADGDAGPRGARGPRDPRG